MEQQKPKMEMRKLNGQDLFPVMGLLAKLGVKEMATKFFTKQKETAKKAQDMKDKGIEIDEAEYESAGVDFVGEILETALMNIEKVKPDINRILADLCGVNVDVIVKLELEEYMDLLIGFFTKPELGSFFKSIGSFMSR